MPSATGRVAVIGDVGGHLEPLQGLLRGLGVRVEDREIPDDLTIVQVGDLVHRGPDSEAVVQFVDDLLTGQPGRWVQLVGNHEAQYLRPPDFSWREQLTGTPANSLVRWWNTAKMVAAATIGTPDGDILVTHAGLTRGFWQSLGSPDAVGAAAQLYVMGRQTADELFRPGTMLGGGEPDPSAGPVWAEAAEELLASWWDGEPPMPFSQIHGHSSVTDFTDGRLRTTAYGAALSTDPATGIEIVTMPGGHRIIGCDPGHGADPRPWGAVVLQEASVAVPR